MAESCFSVYIWLATKKIATDLCLNLAWVFAVSIHCWIKCRICFGHNKSHDFVIYTLKCSGEGNTMHNNLICLALIGMVDNWSWNINSTGPMLMQKLAMCFGASYDVGNTHLQLQHKENCVILDIINKIFCIQYQMIGSEFQGSVNGFWQWLHSNNVDTS